MSAARLDSFVRRPDLRLPRSVPTIMAGSVYEVIASRNSRLAKFTDYNRNVATLLMKGVLHIENVAREWK